MKMPSARLVLFNAAAILIGLGAIVGVVRSFFVSDALAPCGQRYTTSMAFQLERDGALVTPTDIQARAHGRAGARVENLEILRIKGAPAPLAMSIALPKGSSAPGTQAEERGGVTFPWQPRAIRNQAAACLSYNMLVPADFNFSFGGALPGFLGQGEASSDSFLVQAAWRRGGDLGANTQATLQGKPTREDTETTGATIPRGRWLKVEQEVVLNAPGQRNGVLRIWVDGVLAIDVANAVYRADADVGLAGVAADVFYSGDERTSRSPADAKILLTPFELRWK